MNYNNISNYCGFWLTDDSICYLDDSLVQVYYMVGENSKTKIGITNGYGFGMIQRYEGEIYILDVSKVIDEYNSSFELKCYDIDSKNIETIATVKNCDNFLVLNDSVYFLEYTWNKEYRTLALKKLTVEAKENLQIANNVISFGVTESYLHYITYENNRMFIYKYDNKTENSVLCGDFSTEGFEIEKENTLKASYTPNCIFLSYINYVNQETAILKYSFEHQALNTITVEGYIDSFVSYDLNSYFIVSSENSDNSKVYMFKNETDEITEIAEIKGEGRLFAGSDKGVYVLRNEENDLVFYSNEGDIQDVYHF